MTDSRWRLLALPPFPADLLEALFGDPRIEIVVPTERTQAAVDALLPEVDLVLGDWSGLRVTDPGPRVAYVQQPSVGVDAVDVAACTARGIPVGNCAGANTISVTEWCVSATLSLLRCTVEGDTAVRRGEWPQTTLGGRELAGLQVGVVGMGAIGSRVATTFAALGCNVVHWSRTRRDDAAAPYLDLDELLATSDVVVVVIALSETTRHLVDADRLTRMKPGALLVNGARGSVIDEDAVAEAVRDGRLGGAAIDVYAVEPLPSGSPLRDVPGVLLSPHMAGSTVEASMRIVGQSKDNLIRVLDGLAPVDVVNGLGGAIARRS